jgi:hypothetical protein
MMGWTRTASVVLLAGALACQVSDDDTEFTFGAEEMRAAVEGTYTGTVASSGEPVSVTLRHRERETTATTAQRRVSCADRMLCMDTTSLGLDVEIVAQGPLMVAEKTGGSFSVMGTRLGSGEIWAAVTQGTLKASYETEKGVHSWSVSVEGEVTPWHLELARQPQP